MKVCPICQSTYEDAVDFCFKDGAPLELQSTGEAEVSEEQSSLTAFTEEDLEPPEAVSLSGLIPVATDEEDLATLSLAAEVPVPPEEDELATVTSGVQSLGKATASSDLTSSDGTADPFEEPEATEFRKRVTGSVPLWQQGPDGEDPETPDQDTYDRMDTVKWEGPITPAAANDSQGIFKVVGFLCLLVLGLIGYQLVAGGPTPPEGETVKKASDMADAGASEAAAEPVVGDSAEAAGADEAAGESAEEVGADAVADAAEAAAEDETVGEEGEPAEAEGVEEPAEEESPEAEAEAEAEVEAEVGEETEELTRRERAAEERKKRLQEERKKRLEERRERLAEARKKEREAAAAEKDAPEPPFRTESADSDPNNPWVATQPPAAGGETKGTAGTGDTSNPWGASAPAAAPASTSALVTINTKPSGASVRVAGKARGKAPVRADLPVGTHEVKVEKEGFASRTRYLKVTGEGPVSISIALEPLDAPSAKREGTLFLSSSPAGASLFVDGVSRGRTPISLTVSEGTHSIRLVVEGKDAVEKRIKVDFSRGPTVRRFIEIP